MAEAPESVLIGLKNIRQTFELVWNPRAVRVKAGGFDASGAVIQSEYDPRWELWDTDPDGARYMVCRLQYGDGSFRQPGQWLVDHMNFFNPEKWGGDADKMIQALVEDHNEHLEFLRNNDSDDFIEMVSKWGAWGALTKSYVPKSFDEMAKEAAARPGLTPKGVH